MPPDVSDDSGTHHALAEAMRVLGLVQRYGFGIPAARRELRANGQPEPEFQIEPDRVHCTVRAEA